jgi:D-alanyl-D-alanine carboxypeptidase
MEAFAARMNRTAWQLGALNSHFVNPSGLPADDHYSTVRDLTTIMRHALQVESLERVLSTRLTSMRPTSGSRRNISLRSHNRMLGDPRTDVIGKTGWTRAAKKCFIGAATQDGRRVLVAVLGSSDLWGDLRRMVDWTFDNPLHPSVEPPPADVEWQQAARGPVGGPRLQRGGDATAGKAAPRSKVAQGSKTVQRPAGRQKRQAFHVRLGTFRTRDEANRIRKRLIARGYSTVMQPVKTSRQQRYRVSVVGLSSRATAQKVAKVLRQAYRVDTQVVAAGA